MKTLIAVFLAFVFISVSVLPAFPSVHAQTVTANTWKAMAPMPTAREDLGVDVAQGQIYALGGDVGGVGTMVIETYYPSDNAWSTGQTMPYQEAYFPTTVYQDKIYCFCGSNAEYAYDTDVVYDSSTQWSTIPNMPSPGSSTHGSACVVNGEIYVVGGYMPGNSSNDYPWVPSNLNQMYDPATNTWSLMAPLPIPVLYCTAVAFDDKMYVFGMSSDCNATQIYDPQSNSWTVGPSMPFTLSYGSGGATIGTYAPKRIYLFGEEGTLIFDPQTETWSTGATVPESVTDFGVGVYNDVFYLIGGYEYLGQGSFLGQTYERYGLTSNVYEYTPFGYETSALPVLSITSVSPISNQTCGSSVDLTFNVDRQTGEIENISYSLDGQNNVPIAGNTTLTGLSVGEHNLTVTATDTFGNAETSQTITFDVTTTSPSSTATQTSPTNSSMTPTPTPLPTVPEFPTWAMPLIYAVSAFAVVAVSRKRSTQEQ